MAPSFTDGSQVRYDGPVSAGTPGQGDTGRVMLAFEQGAHVSWRTGALAGQITLVPQSDLVRASPHSLSVEASLADSLWVVSEPEVPTSALYAEAGIDGVVSSLDDRGALDCLTEVAQEALEAVGHRVSVLIDEQGLALDDEVRQELTSHLVSRAVRDCLTDGGDDG